MESNDSFTENASIFQNKNLQQLILKQRESEHLHHEDDSNSNNCD
jgi:hypothetical protein